MKKLLILTTAAVLLGTGCVTKTGTGAVTGGALGALAGQAIGKDTKGTLIGAGVGAVLGGALGNQADAQDKGKKKNKHFLPYFLTLVNPLNKNKFFLTTYSFLNLYFCVIICIP